MLSSTPPPGCALLLSGGLSQVPLGVHVPGADTSPSLDLQSESVSMDSSRNLEFQPAIQTGLTQPKMASNKDPERKRKTTKLQKDTFL